MRCLVQSLAVKDRPKPGQGQLFAKHLTLATFEQYTLPTLICTYNLGSRQCFPAALLYQSITLWFDTFKSVSIAPAENLVQ